VSAKIDYAVRATCALAESPGPISTKVLADSNGLPRKFLEEVLNNLRQSGVLKSKRGVGGGYWCARAPSEITLADVARPFVETLSQVRGEPPESGVYKGPTEHLLAVWAAMGAGLEAVLEQVTIADIVSGNLPRVVCELPD